MKLFLVLCFSVAGICLAFGAPAEEEAIHVSKDACVCPCQCPTRASKPAPPSHKEAPAPAEKEEGEEGEEGETTLAPGITHVSNGVNGATSLSTNDDAAFSQSPGGPSIFATGDGHAIIRNGGLKLIV